MTKQISETILVAFIAVVAMLFVGLGTASAAIDLGDVMVSNVNSATVENHVTATSNTGANLVVGGNGGFGGNAGNGGSFAGNGGNGGSGAMGGNGGFGGGSLFSLNSNNWWDCDCSDYSTDSVAGNGGDAGHGGNGAVGGNGGDTGFGGNGASGGHGGTGGMITTGNASTVTAVSNDVNNSDTKIETNNCGDCFVGLFDLWSKDVWSKDDSMSTNHYSKDKSNESNSGSYDCDCDQWGNSSDSSDLSIVKDSSDAKSSESGSNEMSKTHVPVNFGDITVTNVNSASVGNDVHADSNTGANTALGGNGENGGMGGSGGSFAGNGGNGGSGAMGGNGGDASLLYGSTGGDGAIGGNGGHGADAGNGGSTGDGGNGAEAGNGGNGGVIHTGESTTATAIVDVVNSTISRITRN